MRDPDQFDAFYKDARERLLLQAFALTGDLPAARNAVRDAFVIAWHHWRKAVRSGDPEAWARPQAWAHALRRHAARPWHREKGLDPEARATLDALAKLTTDQRRILLLTLLARGSREQHAREVGLPVDEADRQLQTATAQLSMARGVQTAEVRTLLAPLAAVVAEHRFPRPTILRRAGSRRRRAHTAVGAAAAVAALVVSGAVVTDRTGVQPTLQRSGLTGTAVPSQSPSAVAPEPPPELAADNLLDAERLARVWPDRAWDVKRTDDNSGGDGLLVPCQTDRYADPRGPTSLARVFAARRPPSGKRAPKRTAVQFAEASGSDRAAGRAYRTSVGWFAGCTDERTQLLSTHRVEGVGDRATLLVLRSWDAPVTTVVAGVARTGRLTTSLVATAADQRPANLKGAARLLRHAVGGICELPEAGSCATKGPKVAPSTPPPTGTVPAMLSAVDLPPVRTVDRPWVGTEPRRARTNYAATRCDEASFRGKGWSNNLTRAFLIPGAKLPDEFGITQTVGSTSQKRARGFVEDIRDRMRRCPDRELGSDVERVTDESSPRSDLVVWHLTTEVSDDRSVRYLVALLRHGTSVSQISFVPSGDVQMAPGAFLALAERALERLERLPRPRR